MIITARYEAAVEKVMNSDRIKEIMKEYPGIDQEYILELYRIQWKTIGEKLRNKESGRIVIYNFGTFEVNIYSFPRYIAQKERTIDRIKYNSGDAKTIEKHQIAIDKMKKILYDLHEKGGPMKEKFRTYWERSFLNKNQNSYAKRRNKDLSRYIRRVLEEFNICFSDEEFEAFYPEQEGDV